MRNPDVLQRGRAHVSAEIKWAEEKKAHAMGLQRGRAHVSAEILLRRCRHTIELPSFNGAALT